MPDANNLNLTTLPYNLEAEQAVLGSVLIDPECMEQIVTIVKQEYFYLPQHRAIFGSMMSMFSGSKAKIDPVVIADVLAKEGHYDLAGGRDYLIALRTACLQQPMLKPMRILLRSNIFFVHLSPFLRK